MKNVNTQKCREKSDGGYLRDKKAVWSSVSGKLAKNPENLQSSTKKSVTNRGVGCT